MKTQSILVNGDSNFAKINSRPRGGQVNRRVVISWQEVLLNPEAGAGIVQSAKRIGLGFVDVEGSK
jgi:hypothetical protein